MVRTVQQKQFSLISERSPIQFMPLINIIAGIEFFFILMSQPYEVSILSKGEPLNVQCRKRLRKNIYAQPVFSEACSESWLSSLQKSLFSYQNYLPVHHKLFALFRKFSLDIPRLKKDFCFVFDYPCLACSSLTLDVNRLLNIFNNVLLLQVLGYSPVPKQLMISCNCKFQLCHA